MIGSSFLKKVLAVALCVSMLMSCVVMTGVSAATGDSFAWVFGKATGSQNKSYLSYWNGTTNNPCSNWPGYAKPVEVADGVEGDSHAFELAYTEDYSAKEMDSGRFAIFSLPNNTGAPWNGRNDNKTIYLESGQLYEIKLTYRVTATNGAATGGKLCYVDGLAALDYEFLKDDATKDLTEIATFNATQTAWTTATGYVTPTGSASGACFVMQMDDHTKRSGTKVQIGKIVITAVDGLPVTPPPTPTPTASDFAWVFGSATGSQNKSYLSYWNGTSNNPATSGWPGYAKPVEVTDGVDGDTHAMEMGYTTDDTAKEVNAGRFSIFSLPNNTGAAWNGRNDNKTIYLKSGQIYRFDVTYRVTGTNAAGTGGTLSYVDDLGALNDYKYLKDNAAKDLTTLASFNASQTAWTTATAYVTPSGSDKGACIVLLMDDHTKRSGTKVQVGKIAVTAVDEIPVTPPPVNPPATTTVHRFPIDDLTVANITGNGSGKVVKTGAEYDHNGAATGKGMYMHMNQAYTSGSHKNAARFWLENASGKLEGTVGNKYVVTAWVKSMLDTEATLYWAIGTHNAAATSASKNNFQETSFADNKIVLQPGVWTQVTATIDALVGSGGDVHYMTFAAGFASAKSGKYVYVDDITVEESVPPVYTSVDVTYNTMGGSAIPGGPAAVGADITITSGREGYVFDGWYADEACTTPVTVYPAQQAVTLYAGWRLMAADEMTFEVDAGYVPDVYLDMDLEDAAVQTYFGAITNSYNKLAATHTLADDADNGKVIKATLDSTANQSSDPYGFRLVGKNSTASGFKPMIGRAYSLTFKYKVEALPVDTRIGVLGGSINWNGPVFNSRVDHEGFLVTQADVGAGWKEGRVNFIAELDKGVHLVLDADNYGTRGGTVIYLDDIRLESYQISEFTTGAGAARVEGEKNHTAAGTAALKVTNTAADTPARVVYAMGVGNRLFDTDSIQIATAWLYSDTATTATVMTVSDPDVSSLETPAAEQILGRKTVTLEAGKWTRVQMEYGLVSMSSGNDTSYVSLAVTTNNGATVYMDDISVGHYASDMSKVQTYEEVTVGTSANSARLDGTLHGYFGNTVVSGKGYDGSDRSLQIRMQSDVEGDISRAVLFVDKRDVKAAIGGGYIVTFHAMTETDTTLTFALGSSGTADLSDRQEYAQAVESGATTTVELKAGKWQGVSVYVGELQGKSPDLYPEPYITLGAWFDGAATDNTKDVYVDDVSLRAYTQPVPAAKDVLCFEDTEAFGYGKQLNMSAHGSMEVGMDISRTIGSYYSLKVTTEGTQATGGGTRPQFNLMKANGDPVRVDAGSTYRLTFWVRVREGASNSTLRFWVTATDSETAYTSGSEKDAEVVYENAAYSGSTTKWQQVTLMLEDLPRSGYLRLGICGATAERTEFYLDELRVIERKEFTLTGEETVQDYENYNIEDNDFIRHGVGAVSDELNHTEGGGNSLRLEGITWSGFNRNQMILIDPATHQPYEFEKDTYYNLSFWLNCPTGQVDAFGLNAWLWGTDDVNESFTTSAEKNDKNDTFEYDGSWTPVSNGGDYLSGEWNHYSLTFKATNGKYMLMGLTNGDYNYGGYVYYIDDIEITVPELATIVYDPNGGAFEDSLPLNDKGQFIEQGFVGLKAVGPGLDPFRIGKDFKGWSTDKEGKNVFSLLDNDIPSASVTLYAIWGDFSETIYDKIDKTDKDEKDEVQYKTEIRYEKVWTGNAQIPTLDCTDNLTLKDADPIPDSPDADRPVNGYDGALPAWLIIVIIVAAVVIVGGGAVLALLLLKNKKSTDDKEVA